jgi:microcystin-dependent protein
MAINTWVITSPEDTDLVGNGAAAIREIKTDVQTVFPNVNTKITKGVASSDAPTSAEFSALFDISTAASIPIRGIIMWSGSEASIPAGWAICDGTTANGQVTPDLRNRFIVGAADADAQFTPGSTGGDTMTGGSMTTGSGGQGVASGTVTIPDHTLTVDNLPAHEHMVLAADYGQITTTPGGSPSNTSNVNANNAAAATGWKGDGDYRYVVYASENGQSATVGKSSSVGSATAITHDGASIDISDIAHTHAYIPAYYAVCFIMYVGTP